LNSIGLTVVETAVAADVQLILDETEATVILNYS
jgi:hypothetical protein